MKKKIITILKWLLLLGVLLIPAWLFILSASTIEDILGNKDTMAVLAEGKYEIGIFPHGIALEDYRFDGKMKILVGTIEKYLIEGNQIFVIGNYGSGSATRKDGAHIEPSKYYDYETGEREFYQPGDPVAHYVVLNFQEDELRKYIDWEDIPEPDRAIFEKLQREVQ